MLILDTTTKTITAVLSGAAATTNPKVVASWADDNGSSLVEGASTSTLNGATPVTIVAAPAGSTRRVIKEIYIANVDTAPVVLTVTYDNNGTPFIVEQITLAVGDTWALSALGTSLAGGNSANTALSNLAAVAINTSLLPAVNGTINLGSATFSWANLYLATGATVNFANGNVVLTHSSAILTVSTGDLRVTTAGTNAASVVTVGGTQTLTGKTLTAPVISTISNTGTLTLPTSTDTLVGRATTDTLTNKRITKRTGTTTSSATPTINTDNVDEYYLTAQAADITSFTTNLSGTPTLGQTLFISVIGTAARAITWGASFANGPVALPTTTVTTTQLSTLFKWDGSIWRCYATGSTV